MLDNGRKDTDYTSKDIETIVRFEMGVQGHSKLNGKLALLKKYHKVNNVEVEVVLDPGQFDTIEISLPGIYETMLGRVEKIKAAIFLEQLNDFLLDVCYKLVQKFGKGDIMGMIKKAPPLGLSGEMKLEGNSGNGG